MPAFVRRQWSPGGVRGNMSMLVTSVEVVEVDRMTIARLIPIWNRPRIRRIRQKRRWPMLVIIRGATWRNVPIEISRW